MIIIRLWGGLGNQLFQYAFGYSLAKKTGQKLIFDDSFFQDEYLQSNTRFTNRKPMIFDCPLSFRENEIPLEIKKKLHFFQRKNINRLIRIPKHVAIKTKQNFTYVKESRFQYDSYYVAVDVENIYYDGYWQSEKYFKEFQTELQKELLPIRNAEKYQKILTEIQTNNSIAIHIRRGDYSKQIKLFGNLYVLPVEYYLRAIEKACSTIESPKFYIFSDDIEWAKEQFKYRTDFIYVQEQGEMETLDEFFLMAQCKHQIIANSTFSWWGAWLNQNPEKKVWCPNEWFGNRDILPEEWIKVDFKK